MALWRGEKGKKTAFQTYSVFPTWPNCSGFILEKNSFSNQQEIGDRVLIGSFGRVINIQIVINDSELNNTRLRSEDFFGSHAGCHETQTKPNQTQSTPSLGSGRLSSLPTGEPQTTIDFVLEQTSQGLVIMVM